ncbi:hypothetical protein FSARC_4573 [Fusarium sarcochroum]|uniref:Multicopper oxidase n=1 Tax=Fusarium sarcochroum TaxID=1208366 RepID=A0A8H4XAJ7_9HYPO|nr:hypothetical protein FSARC_4573 [Fusarium sarcochroum]
MADMQPVEPADSREFKPQPRENKQWSLFTRCLFVAACLLTLLTTVDFILLQFTQQQHQQSSQQPEHDQSGITITSASISASKTSTSVQETNEAAIAPPEQFRLSYDFTSQAEPTIRSYVFNISRGLASPGRYNKSMIIVNGQTPGPLIEANVGDTIRVKVNNLMPNESTTIHWHGIDQRNTVWMDGVFGITQCGIPPGETFTYEFDIIDQRGTFWYHSHLSLQNTDGLYGPLIIHDPDEKVRDVDEDNIVMVGDLYHQPAEELLSQYLSPSPPWSPGMPGMEPLADNVLINGRHRYDDGNLDVSVENYPSSLRVDRKATVRLRIINHGTFLPFWFSVDNHTLEVVEMDGVEIEPLPATRVFLYPGQRYSVILTANQTNGNYLMHAVAARECFDPMVDSFYPPTSNLAQVRFQATEVLSYGTTPDNSPPIGVPWNHTDSASMVPWVEECLDLPFDLPQPLRPKGAYQVGEKNHHFFEYQMVLQDGAYYTIVNKTNYVPLPDDAALWRVLPTNTISAKTGSERETWNFGPRQQVLVSPDPNTAAQIVINSREMMAHPWHLHGTAPPTRLAPCI